MEILHINNNYIGTSLHRNLINHLNSEKYKCTIYAPVLHGTKLPIKYKGHEIVSACFGKYDRFFFHYKQNKIFSDLASKINLKDFDIVHAYTLFSDGNHAYRIKRQYKIPYIVAVRDTDVNVFFKYMKNLKSLGLKIMCEAARIIFLSNTYKNDIIDRIVPLKMRNEISKKSVVIPNGIDPFWIENIAYPKSIDPSKKDIRILSVGKVNRRKNHIAVVQAAELLSEKGYAPKLTIVGKAENKGLLKQIESYNTVAYHEPVDKETLIQYYEKADIFVLPSKTETFGLVYAEAMSQGLPVIYSKGQGFDGQFPEGTVGFSVNANQYKEIYEKIVKIMSEYNQLSNGCINCAKNFDWRAIIQKYKVLYADVV